MWRSQWLTRQLCGKAPEEVWEQERAGTGARSCSCSFLQLQPGGQQTCSYISSLNVLLGSWPLAVLSPGFLQTSLALPDASGDGKPQERSPWQELSLEQSWWSWMEPPRTRGASSVPAATSFVR